MLFEATATGKTVDEAKEAALLELGVGPEADVEFEVISLPQKKTLGIFGGNPAKVRVYIEKKEENEKHRKQPKKNDAKKEFTRNQKGSPNQKVAAKVNISKKQINVVTDYLVNILTLMGITEIKKEVEIGEEEITINIDGNKLGAAIGRKGETLDALQQLTSLCANKHFEEYVRVTVNLGGYREKRAETLISIANKSASQALRTKRNVVLEPMNSYERRIIHNAIQEVEGVTSWSIGENEHRRVCIGLEKDNRYSESRDRNDRSNRNDRNDRNNRSDRNDRRPQRVNTVTNNNPREQKKDSDIPLYGIVK